MKPFRVSSQVLRAVQRAPHVFSLGCLRSTCRPSQNWPTNDPTASEMATSSPSDSCTSAMYNDMQENVWIYSLPDTLILFTAQVTAGHGDNHFLSAAHSCKSQLRPSAHHLMSALLATCQKICKCTTPDLCQVFLFSTSPMRR